MDVMINDPTFGEMTYNRRWAKMENLSIFEKEWPIKIVAKAFSGKPISDAQRDSYRWFTENASQIDKNMYDVASGYINENCHEFAEFWRGARMVSAPSDLAQIITPKTVLFKQDGEVLVLFDCPWDEHGIAIQLKPVIEIGSQDMFL